MKQYILLAIAGLFLVTTPTTSAQTPEQLKMLQEYNTKGANTEANETPLVITDKSRDNQEAYLASIPTAAEEAAANSMRKRSKIFGHEIFDNKNITFTPSLNIPTPTNYILGPSDQVFIDIWGDTQKSYDLKISPDGNVMIPSVGLVNLSGLTIEQAQGTLAGKLLQNFEGLENGAAQIKISLGKIRSIKVNIVGEATVPGTYTLPSLASLFNAIYSAGGVTDIGSIRNIKLIRNGKEIAVLDIYDYILNGKNKANVRLEENDLILVEPYENIVSITGKVKRERRFELKHGETVAKLLEYAGGMTGDAYVENINLNRKTGKQYEIFTLPQDALGTFIIKDRDSIIVGEVSREFANRVSIEGSVWRPGNYAISDQLVTVKDLVNKAKGLKDDAYTERVQLIRVMPDNTKEIIALNLKQILSGEAQDVVLQKNDQLSIMSSDDLRQKRTISVKGEINKQLNNIDFFDNMTIEDAIMMAGGLTDAASNARLEVVRRIKDPNSTEKSERRAEVFNMIIPETLELTNRANSFVLKPYDEVFIRRSPGYSAQNPVFISGQCTFPGEYTLEGYDDRISSLVKKAGGVTSTAYIQGAHLKRKMTTDEMVKVEAIQKMAENQKNNDTIEVKKTTIFSTYPVGINLEEALKNPGGYADLALQSGDELVIPTYNNTVKVSGAVYSPNAVTYNPKMKMDDYIAMAGGYSVFARKKPFVIYMNGNIAIIKNGKKPKIEPGSEIIIPSKLMRDPASLAEIIGVTSSSVSMLALIANLFQK